MNKNKRYFVLFAGMLIQLCAGIIYMWSIFKKPVTEHLSWDGNAAALTSSVMLAAFVIGIILGGRAQDKFGPKLVAVVGSVMISIGMISTSFVTSAYPWLVYVTYGIIGGIGVGVIYTATVSVVQKWFPDKRGFASGMIVSAFGFSLVIFAPLANVLLASSGVPATFTIFGISFLVICVISSLFVSNPPENFRPDGFVPQKSVSTKKQYTTIEMLKTKQFYLIVLAMFFTLPAYFILNPLFTTLGEARGLSAQMAVMGVMITGIASASGRLCISWLSDKIGRKPSMLAISGLIFIAAAAMIFATGIMFLICIALIAFAFGGSAGVYAAFTADNFGTKYMGLNFGCVMFGFGASAMVFPMISNALVVGGNYTLSFVTAAATCVISIILITFIKKPE